MRFGIRGQLAPSFGIHQTLDARGQPGSPLTLAALGDRWRLLYCFQHWCRGCHLTGFPSLASFLERLHARKLEVGVAVIQTVFEGFAENTFAALQATQQRYCLDLPFAHDPGGGSEVAPSTILIQYRTGGTPWFILIDADNKVVHNDYSLDPEAALDLITDENDRGDLA